MRATEAGEVEEERDLVLWGNRAHSPQVLGQIVWTDKSPQSFLSRKPIASTFGPSPLYTVISRAIAIPTPFSGGKKTNAGVP